MEDHTTGHDVHASRSLGFIHLGNAVGYTIRTSLTLHSEYLATQGLYDTIIHGHDPLEEMVTVSPRHMGRTPLLSGSSLVLACSRDDLH